MTDIQMNLNLGALASLDEDRQRAAYEGLSRAFAQPRARHSDPDTSHQAAAVVKQGSAAMNAAILCVVEWYWSLTGEPATAFQIAHRVEELEPDRWDEGGIRSAVSRLGKRGLLVKDGKGKSPRGQPCDKWRLP